MVNKGSSVLESYVGKCSYIATECEIFRVKIGRFCSIGPRVNIGLSTHPTSKRVTTHPAFYMDLRSGLKYSFHKNKEPLFNAYVPIEENYLCVIGNDVWIGSDVVIMDGTRIGDGAIIAAGAVVTKDVPPYSIYGGVPAKFLKSRFTDGQIEFLESFKWWEKPLNWIEENYSKFSDIDEFIEFANKIKKNEK